jgi:ABC-type polysaccharide/polyol phosphate transport system ATPase subunit
VIHLQDAWMKIPVFSSETRSLKKALMRSVTGGKLLRLKSGAQIEAIRGITCNIYSGERIGLIGHNGAGKSTFLKLISGIYLETQGAITRTVKIYPMI